MMGIRLRASTALRTLAYAIRTAIDVLQASNVDDGAFVLIHVSVLSESCRSSVLRRVWTFLANGQTI
jgi:hypothetical protein